MFTTAQPSPPFIATSVLDARALEALFDQLGLPESGRQLIRKTRQEAPVRRVQSRGGNVRTSYQSRKMSRTLDTESRHIEFPAVIGHEHNPAVIEYYMQPCLLKFDVTDDEGEVHTVEHTPDILVITETAIWLEEWKPWEGVTKRASRFPWRYLEQEGRWISPPVENWLGERGIGYRILTDRDVPQARVENLLMLEDYFAFDSPDCPSAVRGAVFELLRETPIQTLSDIYDKANCGPEEVLRLIASGELVTDIDTHNLNKPHQFRVYRDRAVRSFEQSLVSSTARNIAGIVEISPNTQISYDGRPHNVVFVGNQSVTLKNEQKQSFEVDIATIEALAKGGSITMLNAQDATDPLMSLADLSEKQLRTALERQRRLDCAATGNRSERRWQKTVAVASEAGINELRALVPRFHDRGNREPRLAPEVDALVDDTIRKHYLTSNAPNIRHCHKQLVHLCTQADIVPPSYETFRKRVKAITQKEADKSRFGKRMAYQNGDFVDVLYADTPVHGSRAFQYVHIDHTVLDLSLVSASTGQPLGRPTLSLAIDAYTRRILAFYLSFDPPSTKSVMMVIRDMVRRYQRLPQFLVVDNGPDFRSDDFRLLCQLLHINLRYRPAARARHGSVMERIFGVLHSQYIHNLAGNTKLTKHVRLATKSFLPDNLAEWTLELIYHGISFWAFEYYDTTAHSSLGMSPRQAYEQSIAQTGIRTHRIIPYSRDFLILTCPSVDNQLRTIDRQRGVKVNSKYWYWCPEMQAPSHHGRRVHVRYDPFDASTVFVQIDGKWIPAHCKALAPMRSMTTEQRKLYSAEMQRRNLISNDKEPPAQLLAEFMRVCDVQGATQKLLEQQSENRALYRSIGQGSVLSLPAVNPSFQPEGIASINVEQNASESGPETSAPANDAYVFDEDDIPSFKKV